MSGALTAKPFVEDCLSKGFALAGVTPCAAPPRAELLRPWLAEGLAGSMEWMHRNVELRENPAGLLSGAASIICVADRYDPPELSGGQVAAYAKGRDYHRVMKRRLHRLCDGWQKQYPQASFRACVDSAPIMERAHAEAAGLGRIGKHTLLIEQGMGSWLLLGEVLTTLEIAPTPSSEDDPCGTCTRCIDACPTDAIRPWEVDARRCIAALTIECREVIPADFHEGIGSWLFGCDVCQQVCPHNQPKERSKDLQIDSDYRPRLDALRLHEVLMWSADDRLERLQGTPMMRATLDMWRRNACIAAAEHGGDVELQQLIERIAESDDEPRMVREAARSTRIRLSRA
ncbi:MAG: tRNA epoxyqueuosine(34) reductase QueG [Phycisphaerales bacterium]|nr:tRNA epoxyqueuosine(34) reductase QueG [Phycisphaerales bacterium]